MIYPPPVGCARCGAVNAPGSSFCQRCGAPLPAALRACRRCGLANGAEALFCARCGQQLGGGQPPAYPWAFSQAGATAVAPRRVGTPAPWALLVAVLGIAMIVLAIVSRLVMWQAAGTCLTNCPIFVPPAPARSPIPVTSPQASPTLFPSPLPSATLAATALPTSVPAITAQPTATQGATALPTATPAPGASPAPTPAGPSGTPMAPAGSYTSSAFGFSVDYPSYAQPSAQDAQSVTWSISGQNGKGDAVITLQGEASGGRSPQQVVSDVQAKAFSAATVAYTIPGAEVGYMDGYGTVYDLLLSPQGGQQVHERVVIEAAIRDDVAVDLIAYSPFTPDQNEHPAPAQLNPEIETAADIFANSVTWPGELPL